MADNDGEVAADLVDEDDHGLINFICLFWKKKNPLFINYILFIYFFQKKIETQAVFVEFAPKDDDDDDEDAEDDVEANNADDDVDDADADDDDIWKKEKKRKEKKKKRKPKRLKRVLILIQILNCFEKALKPFV